MTSRSSFQAASSTTLAALADPPIRQVDGAVMDYFLIELVATLRESAAVATARSKKIEQEMVEAGLIPPPVPVPSSLKKDSSARDSVTSLASRSGSAAGGKSVADDEEEPVRQRLEAIGMHVGANFTERFVFPCIHFRFINERLPYCSLCRDRPMFSETLDTIKFICKDIWAACWDKQVDNLRTNHRVCEPILYVQF